MSVLRLGNAFMLSSLTLTKLSNHFLQSALSSVFKSPRSVALLEASGAAVTNFAISIFVARTYDATIFSGYITALSVAFISVAFLRFSLITPAAVKSDTWYNRKLGTLLAVHIMSAMAATIFACVALTTLAVALQTPLWFAAMLSAPGVCLWFVGYEFERSLMIKQGRYSRLLVISVFQGLAVVATFALVWHYQLSFSFLISAMVVIGIARSFAVATIVSRLEWRKGVRHMRGGLRKLGPGSGAYLLGSAACSHAPVFALSLYALPEQAAAFGAMRTLYQPAQIFFRSRDVVTQSRFHDTRISQTTSIFTQFLKSLRRTTLISIILSTAFIVAGPWLVHVVYAGRFDGHMPTFWLWAAIMLMINLAAITDAFVTYAGLQVRYATAQICAGLICIVLSTFLAKQFGDAGAAVSAICGWLIIVAGGVFLIGRYADKKEV